MAIDAARRVSRLPVADLRPSGPGAPSARPAAVLPQAANVNTPLAVPLAPWRHDGPTVTGGLADARRAANTTRLAVGGTGPVVGQPTIRFAYAPQSKVPVGARVECRIKGEVVIGKYIGVDYNGQPCIDTGGASHRIGSWGKLSVFDPSPSADCVDRLTIYPASQTLRSEVEKVLDTAVVGDHTVRAYWKSFAVRGLDAWLIGGLVRDMLGADAKGDPMPASHDIDLAVAAPPCAMRTALRAVAYDLPDRGIYSYSETEQHGTIQLGKYKAGLDVTSLKVRTTRKRTTSPDAPGKILRNVFGGSLLADARLRDFHCNALYYDTKTHTIIDPTGKGYDAAVSKTLSFVDPQRADALIALRYFKFRVRGFGTCDEAKRDLRAIIERTWTPEQLGNVYHRGIPGWGNPSELRDYVLALRRIAHADGVGDLFEQRLMPRLGSS